MQNDQSKRIGAVVLAAGASTRMGRPKQSITYQGESLLRRAARTALAAGCQPVVVVTGANADLARSEVQGLSVEVVFNSDWETGMGSSIRTGVGSLQNADRNVTAVVLLLCDQPFVNVQTITELVIAHRSSGSPIVASEYGDGFGVPALFRRELFPELLRLSGPEGAKQIIMAHMSETTLVPFPEGAVDLDTPEDLVRISDVENEYLGPSPC